MMCYLITMIMTEFEDRTLYIKKAREGAPSSILKQLLIQRAVKCVERVRVMHRDGVGIRKNWNQDLLPRHVWDDFQSAQSNVSAEVECIKQENMRRQFKWGSPYRHDILWKARDIHEQNVCIMAQNKLDQQNQNGFHGEDRKEHSKRLSRKQRKDLKRQQKQMRNGNQPAMLHDDIQIPSDQLPQRSNVRRRKLKHKFSTK